MSDGLIARLRSGEDQTEHAAADEIERLRAAIEEALGDLSGHQKNPGVMWCRICGADDGSWPCVTRMVADDLTAALKGTTTNDE